MKTPEYEYAISAGTIWKAIEQAEDVLSDLLEGVLRTSTSEPEMQSAIDLLSALARHREQALDTGAVSAETEDDDDWGAAEIVK